MMAYSGIKSILFIVISFIAASAHLYAQENCIKKGDVVIDAYYGIPYMYVSVLKSTFQKPDSPTSIRNSNHIGAKLEWMLTDKLGIGLEGTYANAEIDYLDTNKVQYQAGITKYRILAKLNYHFSTTPKLDPYLTLGAGYMNFRHYRTEPGFNNLSTNMFVEDVIPLAVRGGIGIRYFFTDFLAANAEIGLGGPLLQAGVSFKF